MAEKRTTLSEFEEVELELKKLQVEHLRNEIGERNDRKARAERNRAQQLADYNKGQQEQARKQRVCKHRKGGKNNNFANGSDSNYSLITNTYPTGRICISCTRCGLEVWRPEAALKKSDPKAFAEQLTRFREFASYPTDNTPSGSKIFEITAA
jgi:2',3'-cyclic-nucleotide 2'-phosphodiesterase (5'-nucleotidase family)